MGFATAWVRFELTDRGARTTLPCSGITSVFDVGGYPWTWAMREHAARDPDAPRPGPVERCQALQQLGVRVERAHGVTGVLGTSGWAREREEPGARGHSLDNHRTDQ